MLLSDERGSHLPFQYPLVVVTGNLTTNIDYSSVRAVPDNVRTASLWEPFLPGSLRTEAPPSRTRAMTERFLPGTLEMPET